MADDAAAPDGELTKATQESGKTASADIEQVESSADDPELGAVETTTTTADAAPESDVDEGEVGEQTPARTPMSHVNLALIAGLAGVVALAGLTGWLGYRTYESNRAEEQRNVFLQVGRQGALNLTTIDWQNAEADVQRILDSATGNFYDDFQQRAQPFVEVIKQAQSTSVGTIAEAGLESVGDNEAQVLVAVTVRTSNAGAPEQEPRAWRMRMLVEQIGGETKVSNVEFVP